MAEVSHSIDDLPQELVDLFNKAKRGSLSVSEFLQAFEEYGINGIRKLSYAHQVFNLPLKRLKEIEQARGRGLTDVESDALALVLDELDS